MVCSRKVRMSWTQKALVCTILILLSVAVYHAEKGDSFFGKKGQFCEGEMCDGDELNLDKIKAPKRFVTPVRSGTVKKQSEQTSSNKKGENQAPEKGDSPHVKEDDPYTDEINIIITFTNAEKNHNLQKKFTLTVSSLLQHSSIPMKIHIIGDEKSQTIADKILAESAVGTKAIYRTVKLDVDKLARQLDEIVKPMQHHFSYKPGAYYNHALFFLSIAIHRVMPEDMKRVIMLDADLKFMADIRGLYYRFGLFTKEQVIGIGHDMQPVYRHTFWEYRKKNPTTRVGEPQPDGLTGFNSGVLLLNLENMRKSTLYNSLLSADKIKELTEEFYFKGHLGDQDFFTLINMKYEKLFNVLPCNWNRQLCKWWRDHGYKDVFDDYFRCDGDIKIYHGNCNTPIP